MTETITVQLQVNGRHIEETVSSEMNLLTFIRDILGLKGTKNGCSAGHCGACTVLVNGKAMRSCMLKMGSSVLVNGDVLTIEGLAAEGNLHPLQVSFIEHGAVQCGFCSPGMLMTSKALLDHNPNPTRDEVIAALKKGKNLCRCTGYVTIVDAVLDAAERMQRGTGVTSRSEITKQETLDTPRLRRDAVQLVTGEMTYSNDLSMAGMLYGKVLWSEHPHAEIKGINTDRAELLSGVAAVLTAKDIPGENRAGLMVLDTPALADDKVRFTGDPVAVVFAETEAEAEEALSRIEVDYKPLQGVFSIDEAAAEDAPAVHAKGNLFHKADIRRGDPEKAFEECDVIIEDTYHTQRIEQGFLEPESGIGFPDEDGGITIKMGTQCAFDDQKQLARILALPEEKIRVIQMPMGGAFGAKEDILIYQLLGLGAMKTKRPVKITLTRTESLRTHQKRHPARLKYKVGADKSGKLTAVIAEIDMDGGAYSSLSVDILENAVVFACGPYSVPNVGIIGRVWYTNNITSGPMRGFGAPQTAFAFESILDQIACTLYIDPFDLRLRNALRPGDVTISDHVLPEGYPGIEASLEALRKAVSGLKLPEPGPGKKIGIGIASGVKNIGFGHGAEESAGAVIELHKDGRIILKASHHEYGQGSRAAMMKFTAQSLRADPSDITLLYPDTKETPPTGPTTASRQTFLTGNAILMAAEAARDSLFPEAAKRLGAEEKNIVLEKNTCKDLVSGKAVPLEILSDDFPLRFEKRYTAPKSDPLREGSASDFGKGGFRSRRTHWCYTYGSHAAVVEVDIRTGTVQVLNVIAAHDLGKILNRGAVEGQIHSGVMMGIGYVLSENVIVENGINLTDNLQKAGIPYADMMPHIDTILVEVPHPFGPLGLKGFAESPPIPMAPAVTNAIYNALGYRCTSLPLNKVELMRFIEAK